MLGFDNHPDLKKEKFDHGKEKFSLRKETLLTSFVLSEQSFSDYVLGTYILNSYHCVVQLLKEENLNFTTTFTQGKKAACDKPTFLLEASKHITTISFAFAIATKERSVEINVALHCIQMQMYLHIHFQKNLGN